MKDKLDTILSEWTSDTKRKSLITIFEKVRDIPYGTINSRDPLEVYQRNKGTCSGKHFLLAGLYRKMGLEVKDMMAFHKYSKLPKNVEYPSNLKEIIKEGDGIPDYHNFVKLNLKENWVTIDATFDKALENFFVVNSWDGKTDTELSVRQEEIWEVENPLKFKVNKLSQLEPEVRESRKLFLLEFSEWLETMRFHQSI